MKERRETRPVFLRGDEAMRKRAIGAGFACSELFTFWRLTLFRSGCYSRRLRLWERGYSIAVRPLGLFKACSPERAQRNLRLTPAVRRETARIRPAPKCESKPERL